MPNFLVNFCYLNILKLYIENMLKNMQTFICNILFTIFFFLLLLQFFHHVMLYKYTLILNTISTFWEFAKNIKHVKYWLFRCFIDQ